MKNKFQKSWTNMYAKGLGAFASLFLTFFATGEEANPVPVPPEGMSLQTCYELAVLRSENLGMKDEDIRVAQARYWQAVGAVLPKVHVVATESLQNSRSSGSTSSDSSSFLGNSKDQFSSHLNVKQPIFSGFRDFAAAEALKSNIEAGKQTKNRSLQLLFLDVADVFYQILSYEGDLQVLEAVRKSLEDRNQELEKRIRLGKSRSGDLISARSELAQTLVTIEQVKGLRGASKELLSFLIQVPSGSIQLKDVTPALADASIETFLAATSDRPDILAAIEKERASRKDLSSSKGEHWPTVSAEANYFLHQRPDTPKEWNVLLSFDLPIFEGGMIEARIREKKALLKSSQLNLDYLRKLADKEVKTAYNNFIAVAAQRLRVQEALKLFAENYKVQTEDYKKGVVGNLEVIEAQRKLNEFKRQEVSIEADLKVQLVRLHVAAGNLTP